MKSTKLILIVALLGLLFQSCHKGGPWGIKGKGDNVTEVKDLSGFDAVDLSIDADVYYTQDSIYKVEVSAQPNILAVMKAEVSGGVLSFDYRRNVWDHKTVKITIHAPRLTAVDVSGSGDFAFENDLKTSDLKLDVSGSGSVYFPKLTANTLKISVSGSGDLKIADGTVLSEDFKVSGSGSVDAVNVLAQESKIRISGSGNAKVNVTEDLDVDISGSGSVSYKGTPHITRSISGSGRLIHLD